MWKKTETETDIALFKKPKPTDFKKTDQKLETDTDLKKTDPDPALPCSVVLHTVTVKSIARR